MGKLVTNLGAIILRHMLEKPGLRYYGTGLAATTGYTEQSVRVQLAKLEDAGWLASRMGPRQGQYAARRYYFFSRDGVKKARAELKDWTFTDPE